MPGEPDNESVETRRRRMRDLLARAESGLSLDDLVEIFDVSRSVALADLKHLQLSLRHREESLLMRPPSCAICGFVFDADEPKAPSRCPSCKSRRLQAPVFRVASAES